MTLGTGPGIVDVPGNHSVDETVEKLKRILEEKSVALFALVDHSGEAEKAGMKMRPTKLLIFWEPQGGHPNHAGGSQRRDRSPAQDPDLGR